VKARFDLAGLFVWHCHILSHEDNEMMRPFEVTGAHEGGHPPRQKIPAGAGRQSAAAAPDRDRWQQERKACHSRRELLP
jgi:hypothetical protein